MTLLHMRSRARGRHLANLDRDNNVKVRFPNKKSGIPESLCSRQITTPPLYSLFICFPILHWSMDTTILVLPRWTRSASGLQGQYRLAACTQHSWSAGCSISCSRAWRLCVEGILLSLTCEKCFIFNQITNTKALIKRANSKKVKKVSQLKENIRSCLFLPDACNYIHA